MRSDWDITQEPVRGKYPPLWWVAVPGWERTDGSLRGTMPRPPMSYLTGLRPVAGGEGRAAFTLPASPWFQTTAGVFLGSMSIWAADAPFGGAVLSAVGPGGVVTTSELSMSFLRPATVGSGSLTATAKLVHAGKTQGLSEARIEDASGRILAHGTSRLFILRFDRYPERPEEPEPWVEPDWDSPHPYERPLEWSPPPPEVFEKMSGLELFRATKAGEIERPPYVRLFGIGVDAVEEGAATFTMHASEWLQSPAKMLYGGALAILADSALSGAVATTLPARTAYATLDMHMNFLRPVRGDGSTLTARASVVHRGNRLAVARCEVLNAEGKTAVVASGSAMILPDRSLDALHPVVPADEEPPGEDDD